MAAASALRAFDEQALREFVERDERRKGLEREARQLAAENDLVKKDLLAALKDAGKTEISRGDFAASIKTSAGTVSWKEAFLRVAGADEADKLAKAAVPRESVEIRRR